MIRQTIFCAHASIGAAAQTAIVRVLREGSDRKIVRKSQVGMALRFAIIPVLALLTSTLASAGDHAKWARLMEGANQYAEFGAFDKAESAFRSALREAESPRRASLDCAATLNNLGGLFLGRGTVLEAENFLLRAWSELENTPGSVKEFRVRVAAALTSLWIETGKDSKAEALIQRLLATNELPGDTDSAALLGNLGVVLAHKHMFEMARARLQMTILALAGAADSRAIEVRAIALSNMAGIEMAQTGDLDRAGVYYQQAPCPHE
jgi:tetratricopeptide (TPR) repeat protein